MYTESDIIQCFDAATWDYLGYKNRGGINAQKGGRYEDSFAIYKLVTLAQAVIETGAVIQLHSQVKTFVDDLIIDLGGIREHYQLKNVRAITWGGRRNSIERDFHCQKQLNEYLLIDCRLFLVVSAQELQQSLTTNMPSGLHDFTEVLYFPYEPNIVRLIQQSPEFRAGLSDLSAFEQPEPDKLEYLATSLLSVWLTCTDPSVRGILEQHRRYHPVYIRIFDRDMEIDPQVNLVLTQISDFKFSFAKGVFEWDYFDGLETGHLPYSVDSPDFRRFEARVKQYQPQSFEDLEKLL
jgi:hypothetical protein